MGYVLGGAIPTYSYLCGRCKDETEVIKPIKELNIPEICETCGLVLERLIRFNGHMAPDSFITGYNPAFGKTFTSKRQQSEEIRRLSDQGRELIEVGNEKVRPKKKETEIVSEQDVAELKKAIKH